MGNAFTASTTLNLPSWRCELPSSAADFFAQISHSILVMTIVGFIVRWRKRNLWFTRKATLPNGELVW